MSPASPEARLGPVSTIMPPISTGPKGMPAMPESLPPVGAAARWEPHPVTALAASPLGTARSSGGWT